MAAAVAVGTPAAAPAAPGPVEGGVDAILGDLSPADLGMEEAGDIAAEMLTGKKPEGEAADADAPEPEAARHPDEVLFSDEALTKPEGIKAARSRLLELRTLTHQKYVETRAFNERVKRNSQKFQAHKEQVLQKERSINLLSNQITNDLQALRSGDAELQIAALGRLTNEDGIVALENFNRRLVTRSKDPGLDPRLKAYLDQQKAEIDGLREQLTGREVVQQTQQLQQAVSQHEHAIGQRITSAAATMPNLARMYADDPQAVTKHIVDEVTELHGRGTRLDMQTYLGNLEGQLAKHFGVGQVPQGNSGAEPAPKTPAVGQAQRSPGRSVGPRTAAASTPRKPTEDESLRALASDPSFTSLFGGLG
jgi:hypothetical protein